ncbi:MAG: hypothetical protein AAFQ64_02910 [Pseudomonadota bacterium]
MAVSAAEQFLIELINRARLDPYAEAERYNLDLNDGLPAGTIDGAAREVLAPNELLEDAALFHSDWMLTNNIFSHDGAFDSDPGDRMAAAGYDFVGSWAWRENLAWSGTTGTLDLVQAILDHHEGLYRSAGHRQNTFGTNIREIGIAQVEGVFTDDGTDFNTSMLTLNFARSGTDHFLTGVVYDDIDDDEFYSIGEGVRDVTFTANGDSAVTSLSGGYGIAVAPDSNVAVTVSQAGTQVAALSVDLGSGNAKLDLITQADGNEVLALSASAVLQSGIADALLLGVANLDLTGTDLDNTLTGNAGRNALNGEGGNDTLLGGGGADSLSGGAGDDVLRGGEGRDMQWDSLEGGSTASTTNADTLSGDAGDDRLHGQSGRDVLDGGSGDDRLTGGGGRDTFVFNSGEDRILDFTDNVDLIVIDQSALGLPGGTTVADIVADAIVVDGDAVLDFGGGNVLRIIDVSNTAILIDDLALM